jgi:hypothetical protein
VQHGKPDNKKARSSRAGTSSKKQVRELQAVNDQRNSSSFAVSSPVMPFSLLFVEGVFDCPINSLAGSHSVRKWLDAQLRQAHRNRGAASAQRWVDWFKILTFDFILQKDAPR